MLSNILQRLVGKSSTTDSSTHAHSDDFLSQKSTFQNEIALLEASLQALQIQVSDQQKAYDDLKSSYDRCRSLFEKAPAPYFVFNRKGLIMEANKSGLQLLGITEKQIARKNFKRYLEVESIHHFEDHLAFLAETREKQCVDLSLKASDGTIIMIEMHGTFCNETTPEPFFRCLLFDISLRYSIEQQLIEERTQALNKAESMNDFMANMSHEIRTPLAGVIGFADVLIEELPEEHKEMAQLISSGGNRLLNTLNSVLDYARFQASDQSSSLHPVELVHRVRQQVKLLSPLAEQRQLQFTFSTAFDSIYAMLDESYLDRIINNLVSNALKYTEEGAVHISVDADRENVSLIIRDTGIGIDEDFKSLIFEPFHQEHSKQNISVGGVGLGLAITKRLVELMHGTVSVESEVGLGSTFRVDFPRLDKRASRQASLELKNREPNEKIYDFTNLKVLAVEDNRETRLLIQRLLTALCDVTLVSTFDEALHHIEVNDYDIALIDINLGEKRTGLDLIRTLKNKGIAENLYKIAFTAYALPSDQARFLEEGFDDYLSKPFTHHALRRTMARAQIALLPTSLSEQTLVFEQDS